MALLPIEPIDPINLTKRPVVRVAKYGDGYEQRVKAGINNNPQDWKVSYSIKRGDDISIIYDFFESLGGVDSFEWAPPGDPVLRKFICSSYSRAFTYYPYGRGYVSFVIANALQGATSVSVTPGTGNNFTIGRTVGVVSARFPSEVSTCEVIGTTVNSVTFSSTTPTLFAYNGAIETVTIAEVADQRQGVHSLSASFREVFE